MRTVIFTRRFRRDYRREQRGRHRAILDTELDHLVHWLAAEEPLHYNDHALKGNWEGYRDCHIQFDLVLIYHRIGTDLLELSRPGSQSELDL